MLNEKQIKKAEILAPCMYVLLREMLQGCDEREPSSWDAHTVKALSLCRIIENDGEAQDGAH